MSYIGDTHHEWNHKPHVILTMLTVGVWAVVWAALYLIRDRSVYE